MVIMLWPSTRERESTATVAYNLPETRTDTNGAAASKNIPGVSRNSLGPGPAKTAGARASTRLSPDVEAAGVAGDPSSLETSPAAHVQQAAPVTVTGCLEADEDTFRLKDTVGTDAPKSRSWRSGFLKKRSAPIEVIDEASRGGLPKYVGQRVAATGTLVNREMRVHSLQPVAASCS